MIRKSLQRGLVIEPKIELEKHKIKETIEVILSLSDIISEKKYLDEEELLILNQLIKKNKYNFLLNMEYKKRIKKNKIIL